MKKTFNKLLKELERTKYFSIKNDKRLLICFAGVPGSGKSCLAKKLERKYKGVRINSDGLRKFINHKKITNKEQEREHILRAFIIDLLRDYPFKNKLVILDSGIERKYEGVAEIAKLKKWKIFIIRVVEKKQTILKRIKKKDINRFENRYEDIVRWFREFKEFNKKIKSDFIFKKNSDLKNLFLKVDKLQTDKKL